MVKHEQFVMIEVALNARRKTTAFEKYLNRTFWSFGIKCATSTLSCSLRAPPPFYTDTAERLSVSRFVNLLGFSRAVRVLNPETVVNSVAYIFRCVHPHLWPIAHSLLQMALNCPTQPETPALFVKALIKLQRAGNL
ncbi:hypothetical protein CDAR_88811 [Caerostris darwini]|uniref:Uncharacterized protein n=1 Tax=Caerostris darwini TaxID=1538125 RepID=A0AAV4S5E1_9ARAC|nr:hypothetical protein CDAR_88811 [Caerostris darwini]